jgi:hypothetical protein
MCAGIAAVHSPACRSSFSFQVDANADSCLEEHPEWSVMAGIDYP